MPEQLVHNYQLGTDVARPNLLTNGGFEQWQRGNGPFSGSAPGTYGPDRWYAANVASDSISISKDTTNFDPLSGSKVCGAVTFTFSNGGSSNITQVLQAADGFPFAGKHLTFSVRVRTNVPNAINAQIAMNGTNPVYKTSTKHSGSGQYETLTAVDAVIPADCTTIWIQVLFAVSCTAYIDNAMLVYGNAAVDFVPIHPADDLARCLRYFELVCTGYGDPIGAGQAFGSTNVQVPLRYTVRKAITGATVSISPVNGFQGYEVAAGTWRTSSGASVGAFLTSIGVIVNFTFGVANFPLSCAVAVAGGATGATVSVEANP